MFQVASWLSMCLGQSWCFVQPTSPKLVLLTALLCSATRHTHLFPLLSPPAFPWCCDFAACKGPSPVGCWPFYSLEGAQWSVEVLAGLQGRTLAFAQFLRSHTWRAFSFAFSAECLGLALGTNPTVVWGCPWSHHTLFSAVATLADNLILISSLLCFWQPRFPTQAWEFNISTFAWLIRFVSLLWRHCFYGKLMDSHVVFLMAETTPLPPSHLWVLRGEVCKQHKLAIFCK